MSVRKIVALTTSPHPNPASSRTTEVAQDLSRLGIASSPADFPVAGVGAHLPGEEHEAGTLGGGV